MRSRLVQLVRRPPYLCILFVQNSVHRQGGDEVRVLGGFTLKMFNPAIHRILWGFAMIGFITCSSEMVGVMQVVLKSA